MFFLPVSKKLPELNIPKSTIRDLIRKGSANVVTIPEFDQNHKDLVTQLQELKEKLAESEVQLSIFKKIVTVLGFQLLCKRVPSKDIKEIIINTINHSANVVGH